MSGTAEKISSLLTSMTDLLTAGALFAGIGLGAMAAFKLKAYSENPQASSLSSALATALAASAMMSIPLLSSFLVSPTFEDDAPTPIELRLDASNQLRGQATEPAGPRPEQRTSTEPSAVDVPVKDLRNGEAAWKTERAIK